MAAGPLLLPVVQAHRKVFGLFVVRATVEMSMSLIALPQLCKLILHFYALSFKYNIWEDLGLHFPQNWASFVPLPAQYGPESSSAEGLRGGIQTSMRLPFPATGAGHRQDFLASQLLRNSLLEPA